MRSFAASLSLLVAEENGRIVGTAIAATDGWWGWIYRLVVSPDRQKRGIATALVAEAENCLKRKGVKYVNAIVGRDNPASLRVFEKRGWKRDEDHIRMDRKI